VRGFSDTLDRPLEHGALSAGEEAAAAAAEVLLVAPPLEESALRPDRALKIARGVFVREAVDGAYVERDRPREKELRA
jgi:hypothetical protein